MSLQASSQTALSYRPVIPLVLLTMLLIAVDLMVPLGVALGVLYILPLLATLFLQDSRLTRVVAIIATLLIMMGYWISPEGGDQWTVLVNRTISVVAIWVTYLIVMRNIDTVSAIRESEEHNRLVVEAAPSGMVMIDQTGHIVLANKLIGEQFGYTRETLVGQPIELLLPEQFRERHAAHRSLFFSSPESRRMGSGRDLFGLRSDGTEFPVEIELNPLTTAKSAFVLASVVDITARKKTADRIAAQAMELQQHTRSIENLLAQNQLLLNSVVDGIWGLDLNGTTTFVNPAATRMLGYESEELLGTLMHPKVHHTKYDGSPYPKEDCPMYAAYQQGSTQTVAHEVLWRKDGTCFPVEYTSTPITDEQNTIQGAVVIFRNISERIQAEETIKATAHERQLILDNVPALIASFDSAHCYRFANKRYLEWFDVAHETLVGKHAKAFLSEEVYHKIIKKRMDQALAGEVVTYQVQVPHTDGALRWVEAMYVPESDHHGRIQGFFAMILDIHDRKIYEEQVQIISERLRIATQSAHIGIWDWDVVHNVLTWDDQMYALYGTTAGTFSGAYEAWTQGLYPEDRPRAQEELQEALNGENPFDTEFRVKWPDHSIHHLRAFALVQRNTMGEAIRMTGVNWDMTAEKNAVNALNKHIEELRRSNADLEQFAHVVSHDLKAPIRGISSVARWLIEDLGQTVTPDSKENLQLMLERTLRMDQLINGILEYSKAGGRTHPPTLVDLHHLVEDLLRELQPPAVYSVRIDGTLPHVVGDRTQLMQIFQNLLGNAIQHFGKPSGEIVMSGQETQTNVVLTVRDTGIGIPTSQYSKIFNLFQTLRSKDTGGGTGVGLAIVKKIVEQQGGTVSVTSQEGIGTTFTVILPKHSSLTRTREETRNEPSIGRAIS